MAKLFTVDELQNLGNHLFIKAGLPEEDVSSIVDSLVLAELDGISSHGFSRAPYYIDQLKSKKINPDAIATVTPVSDAAVLVDANYGLAYPAIEKGLQKAYELASASGICALGITKSHHCGVVGQWVERAADKGYIALAFVNTPAAMAPWGGNLASFGTNPIAFAVPRKDNPPIVVDLSLSKVARGRVIVAKQKGENIPQDWALNAAGEPTTIPDEALAGTMLPMGEAKGAALALMVEILAATLTGSNHAFEASSFFEPSGEAPGVGQFFIILRPEIFSANFCERLEVLCGFIEQQQGARLPGAGKKEHRESIRTSGIKLPDELVKALEKRLSA